MYAKSFDNNDNLSFRRSEYQIPVNYRGTVFSEDAAKADVGAAELKETEPHRGSVGSDSSKESAALCAAESGCNIGKEDHGEASDSRAPVSPLKKFLESDSLLLPVLLFLLLSSDRRDSGKSTDELLIIILVLLIGGF